MISVDIAVVGAGGAGLSLVAHLDRLASSTGNRAPSVALVDPVRRSGDDRTWCFWDAGHSHVEESLFRQWNSVEIRDRDGVPRVLDLSPMRYVMVRSRDFYAAADAAAARLGAVRIVGAVADIRDGEDAAQVLTDGGGVSARWVFDSRPTAPARPARTAWLQHFRGWSLAFDEDVVDPDLAVLMDFSPPQPERGVAFGYVLPVDARRALVEFTVFSRSRFTSAQYDEALAEYVANRFGQRAADGAQAEAVEDGAIPMTDAVHARKVGRRVFRIGTAGGATRPSTGYTFAAMQRQAAAIAGSVLEGRDPEPPAPYPPRHRWMDAVMLRALDGGHVSGADLFVRLFDRNPPQRVLRFLDGATSPAEDLALMSSAPMLAMSRASVQDAGTRLARRLRRSAQRS